MTTRQMTRILLSASLLLVGGCGGGAYLPEGSAEEQLAAAHRLLERGKERKALEAFQAIARSHPGTEYEEEARFGLARCHRKMEDYPTAIQEYQTFRRRYPRSDLVDDAAFEIGLCYAEQRRKPEYDPAMNQQAIDHFNNFLAEFPESEWVERAQEELVSARTHMARKALANGITYRKLRKQKAALFYFDLVLTDYPDTPVVPEALYWKGRSLEDSREEEEARRTYDELAARFAESEWGKKGAERLAELAGEGE